MQVRIYELTCDPEFERFVPPMAEKERELLEESILRDGCRDAIVVWNNIILDGHNRYSICRKHGIPFQIRSIAMESRDEAIAWICVNQMGRRNITEETKRYLIGKRYEAEKRIGARNIAGKNQYSNNEVFPIMSGKAQQQQLRYGVAGRIGNEYNMNHATVEKYARYAQAIDRVAEVEPRLVPHILSGAVQIGQENMIDIGKLSAKQIKAVTKVIPYNSEYKLSRGTIIEALRRDHFQEEQPQHNEVPEVHVRSVKNMPEYGPDAEVASLTLTIPSWRTSIERVRSKANMTVVSPAAREHLLKELGTLKNTIDALSSIIQEGL